MPIKTLKYGHQKLLRIGPDPFISQSSPDHSPQSRIDFSYYLCNLGTRHLFSYLWSSLDNIRNWINKELIFQFKMYFETLEHSYYSKLVNLLPNLDPLFKKLYNRSDANLHAPKTFFFNLQRLQSDIWLQRIFVCFFHYEYLALFAIDYSKIHCRFKPM